MNFECNEKDQKLAGDNKKDNRHVLKRDGQAQVIKKKCQGDEQTSCHQGDYDWLAGGRFCFHLVAQIAADGERHVQNAGDFQGLVKKPNGTGEVPITVQNELREHVF